MQEKKPTFTMAESDVKPEPPNPVDPAVSNPQIDALYMDAALGWAVSVAQGFRCPVCGNAFTLGETDDANAMALRGHLQTQHFARVMVGYAQKDLDAVFKIAREEAEDSEDLFEAVGLDIDPEAGEHYNSHEVPEDIQRQITADGGRMHWAHRRNLIRYKRRGMEVVGGMGADGTFQGPENLLGSQEMVLMRIPPRLAEQRDRIKARNVDNGISARQEDQMSRVEGIQRKAHDLMASRGAGADQIRNVVSAIGRGLERGYLRVKDQKGNREYKT